MLSLRIDIARLLAAVRRHAKLTPEAERAIAAEFAELLQTPRIQVTPSARGLKPAQHRQPAPIDARMSKLA